MNKLAIENEIELVFSDISYPSGDDFYSAIAKREYKDDTGLVLKLWKNISKGELLADYDFIFFLGPAGTNYYLASYMKWILNSQEVAEGLPVESLLMTLADPSKYQLNRKQLGVVYDFLEFYYVNRPLEVEFDLDLLDKVVMIVKEGL